MDGPEVDIVDEGLSEPVFVGLVSVDGMNEVFVGIRLVKGVPELECEAAEDTRIFVADETLGGKEVVTTF